MDKAIGQRLARCRQALGLSVDKAAAAIGATPAAWQSWEAGQAALPMGEALLAARELGCDPYWLTFGERGGPEPAYLLAAV